MRLLSLSVLHKEEPEKSDLPVVLTGGEPGCKHKTVPSQGLIHTWGQFRPGVTNPFLALNNTESYLFNTAFINNVIIISSFYPGHRTHLNIVAGVTDSKSNSNSTGTFFFTLLLTSTSRTPR